MTQEYEWHQNDTYFKESSGVLVLRLSCVLRTDPMFHGRNPLGPILPWNVRGLEMSNVVGVTGAKLPDGWITHQNLVELYTKGVDIDEIIRICGMAPQLNALLIIGACMPSDVFSRLPRTLGHLSISNCNPCCIPRDFGKLFPMLGTLTLHCCKIGTLGGIELPPALRTLCLEEIDGVSLEGMVLPCSLTTLCIEDCGMVKGFNTVKFSDETMRITLDRSDIGWVSMKLVMPSKLTFVLLGGQGCTDCRNFAKLRGKCPVLMTRGICDSQHHYNHQDAITLFIHNNVLPNELLRYIFAYLE